MGDAEGAMNDAYDELEVLRKSRARAARLLARADADVARQREVVEHWRKALWEAAGPSLGQYELRDWDEYERSHPV